MTYYFATTDLDQSRSPVVASRNMFGDQTGYGTVNGVNSAYIQYADGTIEAIIPPGTKFGPLSSIGGPPASGYSVSIPAINNHGVAAGYYTDDSGKTHGVIYDHGTFTIVDDPSATRATWIQFIGDDGTLYGKVQAINGPEQLFMATTFIPFDNAPIDDWYLVTDRSTDTNIGSHGEWYKGPVAGIANDLIILNNDNMAIIGQLPATFIHTGDGDDAIKVTSGDNIVDAGGGSNFLTAGSGHDEFYVDLRNTATNVWSTVDDFHAGDKATVWGVTSHDLMQMFDNQGAKEHTGLTFSLPGTLDANLTLAGYRQSDLGTRLSMSFGHSPDVGDLKGSDYMQVVAT